jgi:hypothetical protein
MCGGGAGEIKYFASILWMRWFQNQQLRVGVVVMVEKSFFWIGKDGDVCGSPGDGMLRFWSVYTRVWERENLVKFLKKNSFCEWERN